MLYFNKKLFVQNVRPRNTKALWRMVYLLRGKYMTMVSPLSVMKTEQASSTRFFVAVLIQHYMCHLLALTLFYSIISQATVLSTLCVLRWMSYVYIIWKLDVPRASGSDQISVQMLRGKGQYISSTLAAHYNKMSKHEKFY